MRRVGVEEELLLVDPATHRLTAVATRALREHGSPEPGNPTLDPELYQEQLELATPPCSTMTEVREALVTARRAAGEAARAAGAVAVAMPTPVVPGRPERLTRKTRYEQIVAEHGALASDAVVCGMHVHVEVPDDAEAMAAVDGVRPWLPVLLALSANSPFMRGEDTGYASWRAQVWSRWPTAGPREPFGGAESYAETGRLLQDWGAAIDEGMLYFDVRRAVELPTVELRVADVCTEVDDAVLVATLCRALVTTVVEDFQHGRTLAEGRWRSDLLRAAQWRASRHGISTTLVDPVHRRLAPAKDVVAALVQRCADALEATGDRAVVDELTERLWARGAGAARQRAVFEATGDLEAVVGDLVRRTHAEGGSAVQRER